MASNNFTMHFNFLRATKKLSVYLIALTLLSACVFVINPVESVTWTDITLPYTITEIGNYRVTAPWNGNGTGLTINATNVAVDGQNFLLNATMNIDSNVIEIISGSSNILLENINVTGGYCGLYASVDNFILQNSSFNNNSLGSSFINSTNFKVNQCIFSDNIYAQYVLDSSAFAISDCDFLLSDIGAYVVDSHNFTITNITSENTASLAFLASHNFAIKNCSLKGNIYGIYCVEATDFSIDNCIISDSMIGFMSTTNSDFTLSNTQIKNCSFGVLTRGQNYTIKSSVISTNQIGMLLLASNNVLLEDLEITDNLDYGALIEYGHTIFVNSNNFSKNGNFDFYSGLAIVNTNCSITNNNFNTNNNAMLWAAINTDISNTFVQNNIFQNNQHTLFIDCEVPNNYANQKFHFYNNFVNDSAYVNPESFASYFSGYYLPFNSEVLNFNTTIHAGLRIYGDGLLIGGNFWAHPNGTGYSQTGTDLDQDGFIDSPFDIFGNATVGEIYDYLPYSIEYRYLSYLTGIDQSLVANQLSNKITVQLEDTFGPITSGITFNLTSTSKTGTFYISDSSHGKPVLKQVSNITIPAGSSNATFYYKDKSAGTPTIMASAYNIIPATTQFTIQTHATTATHVIISSSSSLIHPNENAILSAIAYDTYGNSWDVTASTSWSINSNAGGYWHNNIYTAKYSGVWTVTGTYASGIYTTSLKVESAPVNHFVFNAPSSAVSGTAFDITITAKDAFSNTVTDFTDTVSLNTSSGSINPKISGSFINGVWAGQITLTNTTSTTITVNDYNGNSGISNQIILTTKPVPSQSPTITPTPSATPTVTPSISPSPSSTPTITPTSTPSVAPTSTPFPTITSTPSVSPTVSPAPTVTPSISPSPSSTPSFSPTISPSALPSPTPSSTTIPIITTSNQTIYLTITGNITSSQISNMILTANSSAATTTLSFTVTGQSGTTGFSNITIPKSAIPHGTEPQIYIDGQLANSQGYTQDTNNYYIWYTTQFSIHQIIIIFSSISHQPDSNPYTIEIMLVALVAIAAIIILLVRRRQNRKISNHPALFLPNF